MDRRARAGSQGRHCGDRGIATLVALFRPSACGLFAAAALLVGVAFSLSIRIRSTTGSKSASSLTDRPVASITLPSRRVMGTTLWISGGFAVKTYPQSDRRTASSNGPLESGMGPLNKEASVRVPQPGCASEPPSVVGDNRSLSFWRPCARPFRRHSTRRSHRTSN